MAEASAFLTEGGEVGALMRTHDWSTSPLGSPDSWPQSLRTVVGLLLNSKFPMFVAWGGELGFLYNDSYAEILGGKHPAALGGRFQDIWSDIWDDIYPSIVQAMLGKATYHQNLPLTMNRRGYEEQTWFTFSYSPVRDEQGKVNGMFCAVTETTEQVLAERHRVEELERMRRLFQQAPGIIAVLRGADHVFELANDAYLQLIGHREVVGKSVRNAVPELEGQGFFELLDRVYATGEPYVGHGVAARLQRRTGAELEERYIDFVYQPIRDHLGRISGIFLEGSDVTEAVRANQALRESEQRLRQLANTIPQLAWIAGSDGLAQWYNDRWYEYTGTTLEEMQRSGWKNLVPPAELPTLLAAWQTSVTTGQPYQVTISLRSVHGEFRAFSTRAAPLHDAAGKIVLWFGTNTDVTDLQQAQEALRLANRRKDDFLAMLAHELRNPLAPISTAAELLKLASFDERRIRQTSDIITRQVTHMTNLVDDLLDVSRVTRGLVTLHEEILNINGLVADAVVQVDSLIEMKRLHLEVQVPAEPTFVHGDRTRLVQVFSNILNNAAKYTPEDGHIALHLSATPEQVNFKVQDDGIGIAPTLLPHIFDLFTQGDRSVDRSQGGLGLGLTLVKNLVDLHGGSVAAFSDGPGKGSRFSVRLPRVMDNIGLPEPQSATSKLKRASTAVRLMVVDDNKDAAQTLSQLLQTMGHQVSVSHTAQNAMEVACKHAPAMLFLDIGLPDMDGYELAQHLRAMPETADSILVAVTGYGQPEDKERAVQAGFDHHLVKPVKLDDILSLLAKFEGN